jgi:hypothetical protein
LPDFLARIPEHLNFDMVSYSQSTIESFIRPGEAQYTNCTNGFRVPTGTPQCHVP